MMPVMRRKWLTGNCGADRDVDESDGCGTIHRKELVDWTD